MTGRAIETPVARKRGWSDAGVAVSAVLAVPLAMIVEWLVVVMIGNAADWREFAVLSLFAVPLLTAWVAIAINLSAKPLPLRLAVAALLLLAPPILLFGAFNV